ncbi:ABC1 family protein, partial [Teladorsagia circumcincta]
MSILHTKTKRQRYFRDCDQVLDEVFGEGFAKNHKNEVFVRMEPYSIGSGCIAQLMPSLSYLEPLSALAQFEMVLRRQVDLSNEARALQKFSENFDHKKTGVKFPTVIGYTKNIIVETFEHGMYINRLVAEDKDPQLAARQSPKVRRRIALLGARALLKMIFVDNFVHGDLHPGNILIRFNEDDEGLPGVHSAPPKETIVEHA